MTSKKEYFFKNLFVKTALISSLIALPGLFKLYLPVIETNHNQFKVKGYRYLVDRKYFKLIAKSN